MDLVMSAQSPRLTAQAAGCVNCIEWRFGLRVSRLTFNRSCAQELEPRIKYPFAFNRPYRDVVHHWKAYILEELGNLLFIGHILAGLGPPGFRKLLKSLLPALQHYMYDFHATEADMQRAAAHLRTYACDLEAFVLAGAVR
jgi:hypothetical protein